MVNRLIRTLAGLYSRLPVKPFRGVLSRLFQKYRTASRNRVVIAKVDGITYQLDLNEMIDSSIYYEGCFEPMTTAVINEQVKPGMTVLDIGANIGCHTLRLAKLVGEAGKVITFEPMSWAFAKLKTNIELNDFNNVILEKLALSNIIERKPAYFRTSWTPDNQSSPNSKNSEDIDFLTLDKYVSINNIDKIDFIKLDVDGYEYKVIWGGRETIKEFKPIMIVELGK